MTTFRTVDFWAPSLYGNTLEEVSIPEPGPSRDPIVRHLPIKYGEFTPIGVAKRMIAFNSGLMVADDGFRMSTLSLPATEDDVPVVTSQSVFKVPPAGSTWTGLSALSDTVAVSALASGRVSVHRATEAEGGASPAGVAKVGKPVLTLSAPELASENNTFAMAGKEMEISVWDAERSFTASKDSKKRKQDSDMAPGEIWRAKNVPHNNLQLRVPVHHLCSAFLPASTSDIVTGTKAGNVRRYDTRQRKPTGDWKLAREGGIAAITAGVAPHEVFFADHSNLVGALDLRTGKMLYTIPGLSATAHFLVSLPAPQPPFSRVTGLATVSSDATLRVCGTTPPPVDLPKGNWGTGGKKGSVVGQAGGVGVSSVVFRGFGSHTEKAVPKEKAEGEEEEEGSDEEIDEDEEEGMWEGMDEAEERSDDESSEDDSSEDEAPKKRRTK